MLNPRPDGDDHLFSDCGIARRHAVVAAVSGGGDSLALLFLLKRWLGRLHPSVKLVAVTVDHDLRPAAAVEARQVAALCERWGVAHRTVRWVDEKPSSGLADAARLARYRLLANAAQVAGTDLVLTGHTLDDQAETVEMRAARGKGRGLAGMARATLYDGRVWILRPLLRERRGALRKLLVDAGIAWIDDPSNENPASERAGIRHRLAAAPEEIERLIRLSDDAGIVRRELGAAASACLAQGVMVSPGLLRLPLDFLDGERSKATIYALRILLAAAGGMLQLPDVDRTRELLERLRAGSGPATLSRTLADRRRDGVYLHREARGLPDAIAPGPETVWDGRFRVRAAGKDLVVPTGAQRAMAMARKIEIAPRGLVTAALAAEPFIMPEGPVGSENSGPMDTQQPRTTLERVVPPWRLFLPDYDILPNSTMAGLLGAPLTPYWP